METNDLKKAGLKVTLPRMKILDLMESATVRHQSAEDIYQALRDEGEEVGLATVYRVLTQFEAAGLLDRHHFEEGHSVFEINAGDHHDHILCTKCGRVDEFTDETIEQRQEVIADKTGYILTNHSLYLYGICKQCQDENS